MSIRITTAYFKQCIVEIGRKYYIVQSILYFSLVYIAASVNTTYYIIKCIVLKICLMSSTTTTTTKMYYKIK